MAIEPVLAELSSSSYHGFPVTCLSYGKHPNQKVHYWRSNCTRPAAVVILLHGGCWHATLGNLHLMTPLARKLSDCGYAVWNIEFRGADQPGGGYPGTFQDVAAATDLIRAYSGEGLDLARVAAVGHSAGGHLALWAAGRDQIPKDSPLFRSTPMPIRVVISLAGFPDLEFLRSARGFGCGSEPVDRITGRVNRRSCDLFRDTSPAALLPLRAKQLLIHAENDPVSPAILGREYQRIAQQLGDAPTVQVIAGASHSDLINPASEGGRVVVEEILNAI